MLRASFIAIGDEILRGDVRDQNTHFLATVLADHSVPLTNVQIVADEIDAIVEAVQTELVRPRPRLILTSGGVGPTHDDVTYEAIAATLGQRLREQPTIARRIARQLGKLSVDGLDLDAQTRQAIDKMAQLPDESELLDPESAWAPGAVLDVEGGLDEPAGTTVVVLPGVPEQFATLVREQVAPRFLAGRNPATVSADLEHQLPESVVSPLLAELDQRMSSLHVGSYPGPGAVTVRLRGEPADVTAAHRWLKGEIRRIIESPTGRMFEGPDAPHRSD